MRLAIESVDAGVIGRLGIRVPGYVVGWAFGCQDNCVVGHVGTWVLGGSVFGRL